MPNVPIEIVSLLVTCSEKNKKEGFKINNSISSKIYKKNIVRNKNVFDFSLNGWVNYKILDRENLNCGFKMSGPVLIEENQTTSVIPKGWKFSIHQFGHLIIKKMNV